MAKRLSAGGARGEGMGLREGVDGSGNGNGNGDEDGELIPVSERLQAVASDMPSES